MTAPAWAWAALVVLINAYWIVYDFVLCPIFGWKTMTDQFQTWLHAPVMGPVIFGLCLFVIGAFAFHMLVRASS